jgi:TetR/AcrR family transcriptional regulator
MVGKPATPAADSKNPTPDQILSVATRLFAARGFDGTSLQDIADAVGIRKPSLLYHFPSKDELRRAVLDGLLSRWNDVLPRLLVAATSGEGQFDALVAETIDYFAADPDRARLLIREGLDRPEAIRELLRTHVAPWVEVISNNARKGIAQGLIHPDADPEAYVVCVINLIIASFATGDCLGAMLPRDRQIAELKRVAKSSLFRSTADASRR